jgi:hypothetical protein
VTSPGYNLATDSADRFCSLSSWLFLLRLIGNTYAIIPLVQCSQALLPVHSFPHLTFLQISILCLATDPLCMLFLLLGTPFPLFSSSYRCFKSLLRFTSFGNPLCSVVLTSCWQDTWDAVCSLGCRLLRQ